MKVCMHLCCISSYKKLSHGISIIFLGICLFLFISCTNTSAFNDLSKEKPLLKPTEDSITYSESNDSPIFVDMESLNATVDFLPSDQQTLFSEMPIQKPLLLLVESFDTETSQVDSYVAQEIDKDIEDIQNGHIEEIALVATVIPPTTKTITTDQITNRYKGQDSEVSETGSYLTTTQLSESNAEDITTEIFNTYENPQQSQINHEDDLSVKETSFSNKLNLERNSYEQFEVYVPSLFSMAVELDNHSGGVKNTEFIFPTVQKVGSLVNKKQNLNESITIPTESFMQELSPDNSVADSISSNQDEKIPIAKKISNLSVVQATFGDPKQESPLVSQDFSKNEQKENLLNTSFAFPDESGNGLRIYEKVDSEVFLFQDLSDMSNNEEGNMIAATKGDSDGASEFISNHFTPIQVEEKGNSPFVFLLTNPQKYMMVYMVLLVVLIPIILVFYRKILKAKKIRPPSLRQETAKAETLVISQRSMALENSFSDATLSETFHDVFVEKHTNPAEASDSLIAISISDHILESQEDSSFKRSSDENVNNDSEEMFSVRIDDVNQTLYKYKIPGIPLRSAKISGAIHWISPGEVVVIHGHSIEGGMIYVGSKVEGVNDPAYINIKKPITKFNDYQVKLIGYWPSYSEISADARGAYLTWLANGKDDNNVDIGFVFLFFYGLERRILIDFPKGLVGDTEILLIRREVERLLLLHGKKSGSVRRYFASFLNLLLLLEMNNKKLYAVPIPDLHDEREIPVYIKVLLGQCANDGIPLHGNAAYQWVKHDSLINKRTPVKRCTNEFRKLFVLRYAAKYGEGIKLTQCKTLLKDFYYPASSSLYSNLFDLHLFENLPDVTKLSSTRKKLQTLVDECCSDLDKHSRYIGKDHDLLEPKDSLKFLPIELIASLKENFFSEISQRLAEENNIFIPNSDLHKKILCEERTSRESLLKLAKLFEMNNIGMEPDVLTYQYDVSPKDSLLLFQLDTAIPKDRTEDKYLLNVLVVELADAIAKADGYVDAAEIEAIQQHICSLQGISEYHQKRLHKHQEFLKNLTTPKLSIKKKLKAIQSEDAEKIISSVLHVVLADGVIESSEVRFLEDVYRYLGMDSSKLYQHIQNPEKGRKDHEAQGEVDFDRVISLKQESAEISAILSEIFVNEEEENIKEVSMESEIHKSANPLDLDDSVIAFLHHLLSRPLWSRDELQNLADGHGLMLDGTLELINENALDQYGLPITEGDDTIEIIEEFVGRTQW